MNIPLSRLVEGIIATMRSDVIPNVADPYARGQAIGVIDLLNNIAPRIEWAQAPLAGAVRDKTELLRTLTALVAEAPGVRGVSAAEARTAEDLASRKADLDTAIAELIAKLWPRRHEEDVGQALAAIKAHLHEEAGRELKKTRKPLFAEIAGGKDGGARD